MLVTAFVLCATTSAQAQAIASGGAPSVSELQKVREGLRLYGGGGTLGGFLDFRSNPSTVQVNLGQLPSATLGLQTWIDENMGLMAEYQGSFLGTLSVPLEGENGQASPQLNLNANRLESAFLYRYFTGPRIDSMAFGAKLGFLLHNITPSEHTPTIVLSTTWFGPTLGGTAHIPITSWLGLDGVAAIILPFNVRESPNKSGNPSNPLGYHAGGSLYVRLSESFYLHARYDYRRFQAEFSGNGSRGLGGISAAASFEQFHSPQLLLEWLP